MKIYISGAMTGKKYYNRNAFTIADVRLSQKGNTVINPARLIPMVKPEAIPHEDYMKIAFVSIDICDTIYMLKGWQNSKGATMEYKYAVENGKDVIFEEEKK